MYKHILLPLDGSPIAEQAILHAEELARTFGAQLTLVSCVEPYVVSLPTTVAPVPVYNIVTDIEGLIEERQEYLEVLREVLADKGLNVDVALRQGRPENEILNFADESGVDVIVMTTHGRSGISRFIYGSVAERVLHGAKVPILLIRATE